MGLPDASSLSLVWENLAEIHRRVDNLDRALELHRRHKWDWRDEGNPSELCASLANRAVALEAGGDQDGALRLFERVEQVCRELPSFPGLAIALGHQAEIYAAKGDRARALILCREQERLYETLGDPEGVARSKAAQRRDDILGPMSSSNQTPQGALSLVEMLGGRVRIDESQADKPVVAVNLRGTRVKDADLAMLQSLEQLQELDLGETEIGDSGLPHLAQLLKLQTLILQLTLITDHGMEHLRGLNQLQVLFLGGTKITDACLAYLRGMTKLEVLIVGGTGVTDAGLAELRGFRSLWNLDLRDTQVTDAGLDYLKELRQLKKINLARTQVTKQGIGELRRELPNVNEVFC
jgi:tetratricopeptide (TPR) repeat protein